MRKNYSPEFKAKVVLELLREDLTVNQISSKYAVHATQLHQWKKAVLESIPEILSDKRKRDKQLKEQEELIQSLYSQIGEISTKLNWLKKKSGIDI